MICIDPNALYTREDLRQLLEDAGIDVDVFIARLRPRKVFRRLFWGQDLLDGLRAAPALSAHYETPATSQHARFQSEKPRRHPRGAVAPGDLLREAFLKSKGNGHEKTQENPPGRA